MVHQGNGGRMPARTERYLPERMNSFIQAGVRAGKNGIMKYFNSDYCLNSKIVRQI